MARNPLSIRRAPNLLAALPARSQPAGGFAKPTAALKDLTKELRKIASAAANATIDEEVARVEGESKSYKPKVQFPGGRRYTEPNLLKRIEMRFDHRPEIVQHALENFVGAGNVPMVSGEYSSSFKLFVNGKEATPDMIVFGVRCEIINVAPYARMLEVGFNDKGKPFVVQTKPNIVERIARRRIATKWGSAVKVRFTFSDIPDPYILQTDFHRGRNNKPGKIRKDRAKGMPINYPSIVLEI